MAAEELVRLDDEPAVTHLLTKPVDCEVHGRHAPHSHVNEHHHVWPKGEGGPSVPENVVVVCATGHNNIHLLIRLFKAHKGAPPYSVLRTFSTGEREYAALGYQRLTRKSM